MLSRFDKNKAVKVSGLVCYITLDVEGSKEMFYLMMHSTHFYLRLYAVRHGKGSFK